MFTSTIASYPERGKGGDAKYRGNCSPRFIEDYLLTYNRERGLVLDPMCGSNSTADVCERLGMPHATFDLRHGFDSRRMRLRDAIPTKASAAFLHPPYLGMVRYSRDVWNRGVEVEEDLSSHGTDLDGFLSDLQEVLYNVFDALKVGATYAVLIGLWRHPETKELVHLPARMLPLAPGMLVNEIIKAQHNTQSGNREYGNRPFVLTTHEVCLVFRKEANSLIGSILRTNHTAECMQKITWRNLVRSFALRKRAFTNSEVYAAFAEHGKAKGTNTPKAKIRQTLQKLVKSGELKKLGIAQYLINDEAGDRNDANDSATSIETVPTVIARPRKSSPRSWAR